ncbi:prostaglandin reductase 1-like isoform X1 [Hermetia illucens]|nr:prostaglandin reductase 1-like isoform X1 [Hermetia illucens]
MVIAKKFVYVSKFVGEPKLSDFKLEEEQLPDLKDDEILCEAEYLSLDPYVRMLMANRPVNTIMLGRQTAKILQSKNPKYPVGSYVFGNFGWRSHTVVKPGTNVLPYEQKDRTDIANLLPDFGNLPRSLALGYLGMPGHTAYFGLLDICKPTKGEVVVVTAAAGAVGSLVGQIAKIKGCTVIGFAGSEEKCKWIKEDLGFDFAFNYKTNDISACLKKSAPGGIDCYFDNVGGEMSSTIIAHMRRHGRIAVCGSICAYNSTEPVKAPMLQRMFINNELKMEGLLVYRWTDRYSESFNQIFQWIQEGKIKYRETITKGFENMPKGFIELLKGVNLGKAIVQV